jgi:ATP-dependent Clp protease adaptor protein ClpS
MSGLVLEKTGSVPRQGEGKTLHWLGWKTVLFNCDCHTFQDVAVQLMKAIRCTFERGMQLAGIVHNTGSAVVYTGPRERCEAVAAVLEDIGLAAKVDR